MGEFPGDNRVGGEHAAKGANSTPVVRLSVQLEKLLLSFFFSTPFTVSCDEFPARCGQTRVLPTRKMKTVAPPVCVSAFVSATRPWLS